MAKRQSLGKGLNALMPPVSRGTSGKSATPAKKKSPTKAAAPAKASKTAAKRPAAASGNRAATLPPRATTATDVAGLTLVDAPLRSISVNPNQPRSVFDEDALDELVFSLKEVGLLQPLVVRPKGSGYELIAGERRLRAARKLGWTSVPVLVRKTGDEAMLRDALLENLHRSELTPLEEAAAYQQLLQDFGCTQDELAKRLGRSRPQITNTLRLMNLPAAVQRRVAAGVISAGHARALLGLKDSGEIERLAARIVAEGLSVRTVEEIVSVGGVTPPSEPKTPKRTAASAPGLEDISSRLSDRLDTRVKVQIGKSRGKVTIEFATLEDLRRIVDIIAP